MAKLKAVVAGPRPLELGVRLAAAGPLGATPALGSTGAKLAARATMTGTAARERPAVHRTGPPRRAKAAAAPVRARSSMASGGITNPRELFDFIDQDSSGQIDNKELAQLMHQLGEDLTETEAATQIEKYDHDGDKAISYEEFEALLKDLELLWTCVPCSWTCNLREVRWCSNPDCGALRAWSPPHPPSPPPPRPRARARGLMFADCYLFVCWGGQAAWRTRVWAGPAAPTWLWSVEGDGGWPRQAVDSIRPWPAASR